MTGPAPDPAVHLASRALRPVTHWHLACHDWNTLDATRFARVGEDTRATHGIARTPDEVVAWLVAQRRAAAARSDRPDEALIRSGLTDPARWVRLADGFAVTAQRGRDVLSMQNMGERRIAHLAAWAMTAARCRCDEEGRS